MGTVHQEDLRAKNVIAVWAGDISTEGDLSDYLVGAFKHDFGVRLDREEFPQFTRFFTEPRLHAHYNRPFRKVDIKELIDPFEFSYKLRSALSEAFSKKRIHQAKTVLVFPHLRYTEELSKSVESPLSFVGNFEWPEGTDSWFESEKRRIVLPPLPRLKRHDWGDHGLFCWEGVIRLIEWASFPSCNELIEENKATQGDPSDEMAFRVYPVENATLPTFAQIRAYEQLLEQQSKVLDSILAAIFWEYPVWRENYLDETFSRDAGKKWEIETPFPAEWMPRLKSAEDLKRLISPSGITIEGKSQDDVASIAVGFACKWDEEHGFGVRYCNGKVTEVGDIW